MPCSAMRCIWTPYATSSGKEIRSRRTFACPRAGKVAYALRTELGEAIANVMHQGGTEDRVYTLTGGETWSFNDVAQSLGELTANR